MVKDVLTVLQLILTFGNVCVIAYAFVKFISRPHDSLEDRVTKLEVAQKEQESSLKQGNDRFRAQDDTNEVLIHSVLALIEFEVHYCETEQKPITSSLEGAKEDLHAYLSRRK